MKNLGPSIIPIAGVLILSSSSHAFDLAGAWATDANICPKIFQRKGKSVSFRPELEVYGSGFIVEGNSIRGKAAKCTIKARRQEGGILQLIAACATDVFPGMEGIELSFDRCSL